MIGKRALRAICEDLKYITEKIVWIKQKHIEEYAFHRMFNWQLTPLQATESYHIPSALLHCAYTSTDKLTTSLQLGTCRVLSRKTGPWKFPLCDPIM